jgi:hypothetical protein
MCLTATSVISDWNCLQHESLKTSIGENTIHIGRAGRFMLWPTTVTYNGSGMKPELCFQFMILSRSMEWTIDGVLNSLLDLLTTYTQDSELEAITAPSLISTIHKSAQHPLSLFQPAVFSPVIPWQRLLTMEILQLQALKSSLNRAPFQLPLFLTYSHTELIRLPQLSFL